MVDWLKEKRNCLISLNYRQQEREKNLHKNPIKSYCCSEHFMALLHVYTSLDSSQEERLKLNFIAVQVLTKRQQKGMAGIKLS